MAKSVKQLKNKLGQQGFTLLEALIYIGLVAAITVVFTAFTVDVVASSVRTLSTKEVNQSARLVLARIGQEIKAARQINSVSPTELVLTNYDGDTVRFQYDSTNDLVNIDTGSGYEQMSNSSVRVSSFSFEEVSGNTIKIALEVEQKDPSASEKQQASIALQAVVVARSSLY